MDGGRASRIQTRECTHDEKPGQRLSQLVWMLFLKIFDDRESEWELLDDDYARLEKLKKNGFRQVPEDEAKSRKIFLIGMT